MVSTQTFVTKIPVEKAGKKNKKCKKMIVNL